MPDEYSMQQKPSGPEGAGDGKSSPDKANKEPTPSRIAIVKKWLDRISSAKRRCEKDFDRMREDMEFVGGNQWPGQEDLDDTRYRANMVVREINQSIASMYARNPKAIARRKQRRDFTQWNGTVEQAQQAAMALQANPMDPGAINVMVDYGESQVQAEMMKGLADTIEKEYQVQVDRQEVDFKLQHKQLVRRVKVCGVGYVRLSFEREGRKSLNSANINDSIIDRANRVAALVEENKKGKFDQDDPKMELLKSLMSSVTSSMQNPTDVGQVTERLRWDFPSATAVIVDPGCKMLKGFIGAGWVVIEYMLDLEEVKAIFNKSDISTGSGGAKTYDEKGKEVPGTSSEGAAEKATKVAVWEVLNKKDRERFFLVDGYKDYVQEPEELTPSVQGFWPIRAITFNDTETEPGLKISIYPESDVRLMRSAQESINSAREALRKHRRFNRPKYLTAAGWMTDEDKIALKNPPDGAVIEIKGLQPGQDANKALAPFTPAPIDAPVYDTTVNEMDILKTVGAQQANLGPLVPDATATQATIAEQSRLSSASSEVDDLDELLSWEANVAGEMMLREMSKATVVKDVGRGAVWPETGREEFVDRIYLEIQASSTGRPNKGLEIANFERIAPLLLQAGANIQFIIREAVKRLDDRLDFTEAFPIMPIMAPPQGQPGQQAKPGQGPPSAANVPTGQPTPPMPAQTDASQASY